MTKFLTKESVNNNNFPNIESLLKADKKVEEVIKTLVEQDKIIAASSFGSLYNDPINISVTSDLDWIVIFKDLKSITESKELTKLLVYLEENNVPIDIICLWEEIVKVGNHTICPILYSIKSSINRKILGKDPLEIFKQNGIEKNKLQIIYNLFSTYTRYYFEDSRLFLKAVNDENTMINLFQKSVNFYSEVYKTMIVSESKLDNYSTLSTFENYEKMFKNKINQEIIIKGKEIEKFIHSYKEIINSVVKESGIELKNKLLSEYIKFLKSNMKIIILCMEFCQSNIKYFMIYYGFNHSNTLNIN